MISYKHKKSFHAFIMCNLCYSKKGLSKKIGADQQKKKKKLLLHYINNRKETFSFKKAKLKRKGTN